MNTELIPGPGIFVTPPKAGEVGDLEPVARLFQRYRNLKDAQAWHNVEQFKQGFDGLHTRIQGMLRTAEEQSRMQAAAFNVFRVLHLEARADELHTTLLAELLNPRGAHSQQYLFLGAFVDSMRGAHSAFPSPGKDIEQYAWFVESRKYIGEGTLDIVISCPALGYLITIDNQLYEADGGDQLARYARWLERNRERYGRQALVYLTATGEATGAAHPPSHFTASYRGQIAGMLKTTLTKISAPHLRSTILQYLDVIQKL